MNASSSNNQRTLMLIFAAATLAFPHMYHLAFTENRDPKSLRYASWAFPLYLLLLSLPVLPILWASIVTDSHDRPYFYLLQLGEVTATPFFHYSRLSLRTRCCQCQHDGHYHRRCFHLPEPPDFTVSPTPHT
jgi:hypothetical protein